MYALDSKNWRFYPSSRYSNQNLQQRIRVIKQWHLWWGWSDTRTVLIIHDGNAIGTFRLREVNDFHKIERMGILSKYRSKGFGKLSLDEIKSYSKKANKSKIILDSIYDVRNFYAKSGFVQVGEIYFKVGIPHVNMYFQI